MEEKYDEILDSPVQRKSALLSRLQKLESVKKESEDKKSNNNSNDDFSFSSIYEETKNKKEKDTVSADEWFNTVSNLRTEAISKKGLKKRSLFDSGKKKKKKKGKETDEKAPTDFNKEFQDEMFLIDNILEEQNKFTASLQNRYNLSEQTKSSARGTGKFTTDLITNITSARNLTLQIIEKRINLKKTIHDLTLKEKKEIGDVDTTDINSQAASFLKEILNTKHEWNGGDGSSGFAEATDDTMNSYLDMDGVEFDEDTESYIKYEHEDVTIWVIYDKTNLEYEFEARTAAGKILDDYPLPIKSQLSINYSTNMATDEYGEKYPVEFVDG